MKRIYVNDEFDTELIMDNIQGSLKHLSLDSQFEISSELTGKFDIFILSGRQVVDREVDVSYIRQTFGAFNNRLILMSVSPSILEQAKKQFNVFKVLNKDYLIIGFYLDKLNKKGVNLIKKIVTYE